MASARCHGSKHHREINRHGQSNQRQQACNQEGKPGVKGLPEFAAVERLDAAAITDGGNDGNNDSDGDERNARRQRKAGVGVIACDLFIAISRRNRPNRAMTKPNPISETPVRIQARNVRSTAR